MDIIIRNEEKTVIDICAAKMEKILMNSTEAQALFMTGVLEYMAQNIESVS